VRVNRVSTQETKESWEEWLRKQHPVYQTIFRGLQSVFSKADNGADIRVWYAKDRSRITVETRTLEFGVGLDGEVLRARWVRKYLSDKSDEVGMKVKRATACVQDVKKARDFMDSLVDIVVTTITHAYGLTPEDLYYALRSYVVPLR
jgi:hypothetical protein